MILFVYVFVIYLTPLEYNFMMQVSYSFCSALSHTPKTSAWHLLELN